MLLAGIGAPHCGLAGVIEVVLTSSNTPVTLSTLFTTADWNSATPKRVVVPAGVTRGTSSAATPAVSTGTAWGGTLELLVNGDIDGGGGAANSGTGGTALQVNQASGFILTGTGRLRGGGGGGGKGGTGGAGLATTTEGPSFSGFGTTGYLIYNWGQYSYYWAGSNLTNNGPPSGLSSGGWTYYQGAYQGNYMGADYWAIYRQQSVGTSGGTGGNGGRGAGSDGAAASGAAGSAGGTNAGTGGTGGTGGAFGSSGATGSTGAAGNNGSGTAGTAGGLAGYGIFGSSGITNLFTGSIIGRTG